MRWYFLRPHRPLLVGDGRSYGGGFYRGSLFPLPQTVLGAARAKAADVLGFDWDYSSASEEVRRVVGTADEPGSLRVGGVFFATRRLDQNQSVEICFPRPADMVVFPPQDHRRPNRPRLHPLRPTGTKGVKVNPPVGLRDALAPLGHLLPDPVVKPTPESPGWMKPGPFLAHLCQSSATPGPFHGVDGPLAEDRTHVRIEDETLAAEEGALFAAGRLAFDAPLDDAVEHGLAVEIEGADSLDLSGVWRLGGKGSLVEAARTEPRATDFDAIRQAAIETLGQAEGRFRWVLVTPARFPRGWLPSFIADNGTGTFPFTNVQVHLRAAVVGRPMAYSGWDLAANGSSAGRSRGEPRPTRLFVPSGSVYFFEVSGGGVEEARRIAERAWLKPLAEVRIDEGWNPARRRAVAIDRACGLARGMFGPWNWYDPEEEQ